MQTAAIAASAVAARTVGGTLNTTAASSAAAADGIGNHGNVSDAAPVLGVVRAAAAELSNVQFDVEDRSRYAAMAHMASSSSSFALDDNTNTLAATTLSFSGPHGAAFSGGARFRPTVMPSTRSIGLGAMQLTPQPRGALADLKPATVSAVAANTSSEGLGGDIADELPLINVRVEAVGLNFRDVLNVLGMYPGEPGPPGRASHWSNLLAQPEPLCHRSRPYHHQRPHKKGLSY